MINEKLQKDIIEWHKTTFSLATIESQILKWQEEFRELEKADNYRSYLQELCDCIIVAVAFKRFSKAGEVMSDVFNKSLLPIVLDEKKEHWDLDNEIIERFVEVKLKINKQRKWEFINGVYKHAGD